MKTTVKFVLSTLVAAAAMTNFAASAMGADIPEIPSDIIWDGAVNKKLESGTQSSDYYGGSGITVLGKENGDGPVFRKKTGSFLFVPTYTNYKFRGASLQMDGDDSHVYIYGGEYYDKVSAVDNMTTNPGIVYGSTVNASTGHMYIYGGTFKSDITGLGMAQSGTHTANTDIHILGGIENGSGMGVFGGVSGASGGSASLVGNTSVTVSGNGNTSFIAGGNRMAADLTGNITLSVENGGTVGGILGGNYFHNTSTSTSTISGDISISIDGGIVSKKNFAVSGIVGGGMNTNVSKSTNISIQGSSTIAGGIAGGSAGWGTVNVAATNISVCGGSIDFSGTQSISEPNDKEWYENLISPLKNVTVSNAIIGGSIAVGVLADADYTVTMSNITISGGTLNGNGNHIYGGGIAYGTSSYTAKSHVESANITIDASENTVTINGNIYGGGRADTADSTATVDNANIVFKGDGANLKFTGTVDGNGSGAGVCSTENSTFTFDGYTGAFNGTIQNFDELVVKNNSAVTGANGGIVKIENIAKVTLKDTSTLKLETAVASGGNLEINGGSLIEGSSVELTANASVTVAAAEGSVTLTSVAGNVVVKEATQLDASTLSFENKDGAVLVQTSDVLAVWDFVVENAEGGVTVTMDVGEGQVLESLRILHEENGEWTDVTSVVTDKKLENGKLSFTAKDFSGYAVAMPEPSMFGLMAGLGALVLVGTRRRRK